MQEVEDALTRLPPPPSENPSQELLRLVTGFSADVANLVEGTQSFEQLIQRCRPAYIAFRRDIRRTAPDFRSFTGPNDPEIHPFSNPNVRIQVVTGDSEDGDDNLVKINKPVYLPEVRDHIQG